MFKHSLVTRTVIAGVILAMTAGSAFPHITLETGKAAVGASYKAVFRVPHGCAGQPTTAVRVQIPEGVIAAKPMPKPGWALAKTTARYAKSYDYYGTPTAEGVTEIAWSGGSLPDDEYDEFVLRVFLTPDLKPGSVLHFPVVQECAGGTAERWIEIPAAGQSEDDLELPAPGVELLEKAGSGG